MAGSRRNTESKGRIEFDHLGIGTVLSRNRLIVPVNQREYAWKDENVLDLLHDFSNAIRTSKSSYFLGTIVLTGGDDGAPEVADGQQRLATTTILLAAIRDYLHLRKEDMLVNSIESDFLFKIVRETKELSPRLTLNVQDNEFFRRRILLRPEDPQRVIEASKGSHRKIENAANRAAEHVENLLSTLSDRDKVAYLNEWVKFIEYTAQVIVLKVPDDLNAFVMFETLNDRGVKTSQADLLKNYLFQQADDRIDEAQQKWAAMSGALESLETDDVTLTYLRHLVSSLHGLTRDRDVFEKIKDTVAGKGPAVAFLYTLADYAIEYVAILNSDHSKWNSYKASIRKNIRTLNVLQAVQIRPLMLAVARNFSSHETERAFRLFVSWTVRFLIAGGRGGTLEEAYSERAKEVTEGKITTTQQLAAAMDEIVPTDTQFEAEFASARVSKSHLARYYLRALELQVKQDPEPQFIPNEETVINLEHVLPENPDAKDWGHIDPETARAYYKRLGNMVLLQASRNSSIGNRAFDVKKPILKDSSFILTAEVGKQSVWSADEIKKRQENLAKLAVQTWPIDVR